MKFLCIFFLLFFKSIRADYGADFSTAYCNFPCGKEHTVCKRFPCKPVRHCKSNFRIIPMTDNERDFILEFHNAVRNEVAGQTSSFHLVKHNLPQGEDLLVFSYNKELEYIAQCHANTCPENFENDVCRSTATYAQVGQNIYVTPYKERDDITVLSESLRKWQEDIHFISEALIKNYEPSDVYDHSAQLLWSDTKEVGCGMSRFGRGVMLYFALVCNYGPSGRLPNKSIYKIGMPCKSCECNLDFPNLCGEITDYKSIAWNVPNLSAGTVKNIYKYTVFSCLFIIFLLN